MLDLRAYPRESETLALHSMIAGIEEHTEFEATDITKMLAMCYDLDRTRQYLLAPAINSFVSRFPLELYGFTEKMIVPSTIPQNLTLCPTSKRLKSHHTAIEMRGKLALVWFEPEHDLAGLPDYGRPQDGGLLIAVHQTPEAFEKVYDLFKNIE